MIIPKLLKQTGYPCLVLKIWAKDIDKVKEVLKRLEGKTVSARYLYMSLRPLVYDLRVGTTFDIDRWWDEERWSVYSYPFETLLKQMPKAEFMILPFNDETRAKWFCYTGLGAVNIVKNEPLAILLYVPLTPRRCVVFEIRKWVEKKPIVYAYTANKEARTILARYGFTRESPEAMKRVFSSVEEMARVLSQLDNELRLRGLFTFMICGLRDIVKEYTAIPA